MHSKRRPTRSWRQPSTAAGLRVIPWYLPSFKNVKVDQVGEGATDVYSDALRVNSRASRCPLVNVFLLDENIGHTLECKRTLVDTSRYAFAA